MKPVPIPPRKDRDDVNSQRSSAREAAIVEKPKTSAKRDPVQLDLLRQKNRTILELIQRKLMERVRSGPNEILHAFHFFDKDRNGRISAEEFKEALERFGLSLSRAVSVLVFVVDMTRPLMSSLCCPTLTIVAPSTITSSSAKSSQRTMTPLKKAP